MQQLLVEVSKVRTDPLQLQTAGSDENLSRECEKDCDRLNASFSGRTLLPASDSGTNATGDIAPFNLANAAARAVPDAGRE